MKKKLFRARRSFDKTMIVGQLIYIEGNAHIIQDCDIEEDGHHFHQISDMPTWVDEDTIEEVTAENLSASQKQKSDESLFDGILPDDYQPTVSLVTNVNELTKDGVLFYIVKAGEVTKYRFLCEHPDNSKYILALNGWTGDANKMYLPDLMADIDEKCVYIGVYDTAFFNYLDIKYHKYRIKGCEHFIEKALEYQASKK